jgi:hypothetical protein
MGGTRMVTTARRDLEWPCVTQDTKHSGLRGKG